MVEFPEFRKSKAIKDMIIEINHLEENGDKLYTEAMRRLYSESGDAVEILSWTVLMTDWKNAAINARTCGWGGNGYSEAQLTLGNGIRAAVFLQRRFRRTGAHFPGSSQDFLRHVILYNFHFLFPSCCVIIKTHWLIDKLHLPSLFLHIIKSIFLSNREKDPTMKANIFIP